MDNLWTSQTYFTLQFWHFKMSRLCLWKIASLIFFFFDLPRVENAPTNTTFMKDLESFGVQNNCKYPPKDVFVQPLWFENVNHGCSKSSVLPCQVLVVASKEICKNVNTEKLILLPHSAEELLNLQPQFNSSTFCGNFEKYTESQGFFNTSAVFSAIDAAALRNFFSDELDEYSCKTLCIANVTAAGVSPLCILAYRAVKIVEVLQQEIGKNTKIISPPKRGDDTTASQRTFSQNASNNQVAPSSPVAVAEMLTTASESPRSAHISQKSSPLGDSTDNFIKNGASGIQTNLQSKQIEDENEEMEAKSEVITDEKVGESSITHEPNPPLSSRTAQPLILASSESSSFFTDRSEANEMRKDNVNQFGNIKGESLTKPKNDTGFKSTSEKSLDGSSDTSASSYQPANTLDPELGNSKISNTSPRETPDEENEITSLEPGPMSLGLATKSKNLISSTLDTTSNRNQEQHILATSARSVASSTDDHRQDVQETDTETSKQSDLVVPSSTSRVQESSSGSVVIPQNVPTLISSQQNLSSTLSSTPSSTSTGSTSTTKVSTISVDSSLPDLKGSEDNSAKPGGVMPKPVVDYDDSDGDNNAAAAGNVAGRNEDLSEENVNSNAFGKDYQQEQTIQRQNKVQNTYKSSGHYPPNSYGGEPDTSLKGNDFSLSFDGSRQARGDEDVGFFSYFLTFVAVVGICWLLFHNKKRIIAMVVEGRRPRTARRRSSSGSYRKLENNFD